VQLLPAPYAQFAAVAAAVTNGAITAAAIANGAVGNSQLASNLTVGATLNVVAIIDEPILHLEQTLNNHDATLSIGVTGQPFWQIASSHGLPELEFKFNFGNVITFESSGNINASGSIHASGDICGATFCGSSDRNLKERFTPIDNQEILERVASLPISRWNFKTDGMTRHIGPMAQDFYAAFNVGTDDKHIATVDEGGVALAAIQGLNEKLQEKDAQMEALGKRLADLERLVRTPAEINRIRQ
jgi:hypothetical protein